MTSQPDLRTTDQKEIREGINSWEIIFTMTSQLDQRTTDSNPQPEPEILNSELPSIWELFYFQNFYYYYDYCCYFNTSLAALLEVRGALRRLAHSGEAAAAQRGVTNIWLDTPCTAKTAALA